MGNDLMALWRRYGKDAVAPPMLRQCPTCSAATGPSGLAAWLAALFVLAASVDARPWINRQEEVSRPAARGYAIYGDIDVEFGFDPSPSRSLQLVLQDETGRVVGALLVGGRSQYRFSGLPAGEYLLVLQAGVAQLGRLHVLIGGSGRPEIRQDLTITQQGAVPAGYPGGDAPRTLYARPAANQAHWKAAARLAKQGKWKGVEQLLERVTDHDASDFEAWTELGTAQFKLRQWQQAEASMLRATEARPDYFRAWLNLGKLRFKRKDFEGSIEALQRALQLRPNSVDSHYFLGECYLSIQLGSKAVPHLEEAIRLAPQAMADVHLRLAQLYHGAGLRDRAAREFTEYLKKRPRAQNRKAIQKYIQQAAVPKAEP